MKLGVESPVGGARQVLVVEDDRDVCDAIRESLEDAGYRVCAASNGADALALLRDLGAMPDLILLDLMMPVMDGERFLEEFRREGRLGLQFPGAGIRKCKGRRASMHGYL